MPVHALAFCLAASGFHAQVGADHFTLAWQHSIEKVRWEEDYRVQSPWLVLTEARIRGAGAGMEPPPGAVLQDGVWRYRPQVRRLARLTLARSNFVADYDLCVDGRCRPLSDWVPVSVGVTTIAPCATP